MRAVLAVVLALLLTHTAPAQTIEEMAGQMILVGFAGDGVDDASVVRVREAIAEGRLGGVMLLKTNVASLAAVSEMNAAFLAANPGLPPFITVDQEGGSVERLTEDVGFKEIPNARLIAVRNTPERAMAVYADLAARIAALGFTVNFGPVVDLDINPNSPAIGRFGRAYSADPDTVSLYGAAFVSGHARGGMLTALKHFPGHGSSTADSHEGFTDITRTWQKEELKPYQRLIDAGFAQFVMVGHLYHEDYSGGDTRLPASLSPEWITGVLRGELGFDGVVISDDLEMGAIRQHFDLEETVIRAVNAGMDVLLFSNTAEPRASLGDEVRAILVAESARDPAFAEKIAVSYARIVKLKATLAR